MLKKILPLCITALLLSTSCASINKYLHRNIAYKKVGFGYSLAQTPEDWKQGGEVLVKMYHHNRNRSKNKISNHSAEYSLNLLSTGSEIDLYEFGLTHGFGKYDSKSKDSLELLVGVLRMGINKDTEIIWTPEIKVGLEIYPFYLQTGIDFYLYESGDFNAGFGFNGGMLF